MNKAKTLLSVVVAAGLIIAAAGLTSHAISDISAGEAHPKTETVSTQEFAGQSEQETDWSAYADSLDLAEIIDTADLTTVKLDVTDFRSARLKDGRDAVRVTLDRHLTDDEKAKLRGKHCVGVDCIWRHRYAPEITGSYFYVV